FFAPETWTVPSSARPPEMRSLSTGLPLLRRERAHGERVDLLAHAIAQGGVNHLVALHAALALEGGRDDERLEVLAIADDFDMPALEAGGDALLDAFGIHHGGFTIRCSRDGFSSAACSPRAGARA